MKKVIVCEQKPKDTDTSDYNMVVAKIGREWYQLSKYPDGGVYWKQLGNGKYRRGAGFPGEAGAIEYIQDVNDADVYSFKNLDEFIQFYQEEK